MKRAYALVAVAFVLSFIIHFPLASLPLLSVFKYSDVVGILTSRVLKPTQTTWELNGTIPAVYIEMKTIDPCSTPYKDYFFEYPVISASVFYTATCLGGLAAKTLTSHGEAYLSYALLFFYVIISMILGVVFFVSVYAFKRLLELTGADAKLIYFFVLSPSVVVYTIYNFDIIAVALMLAGVYFFIRGKPWLTGLMFGLSIPVKVIPVAVAYTVFLFLLKRRNLKELASYTVGGIVGALPILLHIIAGSSLSEIYRYVGSWYCENCLYVWVLPDLYSPIHRILFLVLGSATAVVLAVYVTKSSELSFYRAALASVCAVTVFNYINPPQFFLYILPLALLVAKQVKTPEALLLITADWLNAAFIGVFMWETPFIAAYPGSIAQSMFFVRNALLVLLLLLPAFQRRPTSSPPF